MHILRRLITWPGMLLPLTIIALLILYTLVTSGLPDKISVALIAVIGSLIGAIVGGLISFAATYYTQKMQFQRESQTRLNEWRLLEVAGRTSAIKDVIVAAMKLDSSIRFPTSGNDLNNDLNKIRNELFGKLHAADFDLIGTLYTDMKGLCEDFKKCVDELVPVNDLTSTPARETIKRLHDMGYELQTKIDSHKEDLASNW